MSQTPPNPGWQAGPQGPSQPFNGRPPQGPPPGYPGTQYGGQPPQGPPPGYPGAQYGSQPPQGYPQQGFGQQQSFGGQPPQGPAPVKSGRKTKVIVAGAVGVAVAAAAVGLGLFFFRGSTPAAAQGLPADVSLAVEANLAPSNADKLALKSIADKFPSLTSDADLGSDYKQALFRILAQDSPDAPDYETEIKPWLGDSIAIGLVGDPSDAGDVVLAVQTTDKGKAEAFMLEEGDNARVQFIDNLMVVTEEGSSISVDDISKNSLADSDQYKADLQRLGDGNLATFWFGPSLLDAVIEQAEAGSGMDAQQFDTSALEGAHGAAGLRVGDDLLTTRIVLQTPNAPESTGGDVSELAGSLPGDAIAVMATGTSDETFQQLWSALGSALGGDDLLSEFGIEGVDDLKALLGDRVGLSIGLQDGMPTFGAKLETGDPARQKDILDKIDQLLQEGGIPGITLDQSGSTGIVAYGQSADSITGPATSVGDLDTFKKVVGGEAQAILFLNIDALKATPDYDQIIGAMADEQTAEILAPISSVGIVGNAVADHYSEAFLHVTFE